MTTPHKKFRQGTTDPLEITLMDGDSVANLTGYASITIFLRSADGLVEVEKTTPTDVTCATPSSGVVSVNFAVADLLFSKGSYHGYVIVVDGSAKRSSFPDDGDFVIDMLERYSGDG
jgi:hypothetical protein